MEADRLGEVDFWGGRGLGLRVEIDLQHQLYRITLEDRLFLAPIGENVQEALDVGTGTGLWAIEFGECEGDAYYG